MKVSRSTRVGAGVLTIPSPSLSSAPRFKRSKEALGAGVPRLATVQSNVGGRPARLEYYSR
jgi:hypothetical protein